MAVFTSAGAAIVVDVLDVPTAIIAKKWSIDWGLGTTPTSVPGDTALVLAAATVAGRLGVAGGLVVSQPSPHILQWVGTMVAVTGTASGITEAGVFDATAAGNMLIHGMFPEISLSSGDSIEFTFTLAFS